MSTPNPEDKKFAEDAYEQAKAAQMLCLMNILPKGPEAAPWERELMHKVNEILMNVEQAVFRWR